MEGPRAWLPEVITATRRSQRMAALAAHRPGGTGAGPEAPDSAGEGSEEAGEERRAKDALPSEGHKIKTHNRYEERR